MLEDIQAEIIEINLNTFKGTIPPGFDLVEYEKGTDPINGCTLYGFDEVGQFFPNGSHCLLKVL